MNEPTSAKAPLLDDTEEGVSEHSPASDFSQDHERYQIIDYFRHSHDKSALLNGFLRFVSPCFGTIVVFSVQPRWMKFLTGRGVELKNRKLLETPIGWMESPLVRRMILQRMPYQGPIPIDIEEKQVFAQFLQNFPAHCWLYPAAIGDAVDCLIYADTPTMAPRVATERLEFVIGKLVLAMRRLLVEHLLVHG